MLSLAAFAASLPLVPSALAATFTWDGGGGDGNTGTALNWSTDVAPATTGDNLVFAGSTNTTVTNNSITSLSTATAGSFTFASGAGSFNVGGNAFTVGSGGGGGLIIVQQNSTNAQTISANLNFSGGNGDRSIVFGAGAGSLTLSGNIAFSNDWLFPTTTAGTIILSGSNTGDGKGTNAITAGTNIMRAMMRNNVAGTTLTLGSDGALGNSGTGDAALGTASLRGVIANQNMTINTANGARNLSGSTLAINAGNITFTGADNLTIGGIVNQGGNRDFVNSSNTGQVTVATGIYLSGDQTGRRLYDNLSGTGGMVANGKIYDTLHSGGITTNVTTTDTGATSTKSILRKAGAGTLTLNGDSSTTFNGVLQIEAGTVKLGHSGALGASDGTATTATQLMGGTLDVNGQTSNEYVRVLSNSTLVNSNATAGALTANTELTADLAINTTGNLTASRLVGLAATRTITKTGNGTLTTNGTSHNNLTAWDIQAGTVVFANTSGYGSDRGTTLNGGTLRLSGANSDLINDGQAFTINTGIFELNGKAEAVASVGGSGGTIRNGLAASNATLYVGGGVSGSSTASYSGTITDGAGTLALTKEGSGTQTLGGTLSYSGSTTISNGAIVLGAAQSLTGGLVLGGGSLDAGTFTSSFGALDLNANGTINLGTGAVLAFLDSSSIDWGVSSLSVTGTFVDGASLRFGTTATGLTSAQLSQISVNGSATPWYLNDNGYLTAVPEPATWSGIAGLAALGLAWFRRQRRT